MRILRFLAAALSLGAMAARAESLTIGVVPDA